MGYGGGPPQCQALHPWKKPLYPGKEKYLGSQVWGPLGDPRELEVAPPQAESLGIAAGAAELKEGIQTGEPAVASCPLPTEGTKGGWGPQGPWPWWKFTQEDKENHSVG